MHFFICACIEIEYAVKNNRVAFAKDLQRERDRKMHFSFFEVDITRRSLKLLRELVDFQKLRLYTCRTIRAPFRQ